MTRGRRGCKRDKRGDGREVELIKSRVSDVAWLAWRGAGREAFVTTGDVRNAQLPRTTIGPQACSYRRVSGGRCFL